MTQSGHFVFHFLHTVLLYANIISPNIHTTRPKQISDLGKNQDILHKKQDMFRTFCTHSLIRTFQDFSGQMTKNRTFSELREPCTITITYLTKIIFFTLRHPVINCLTHVPSLTSTTATHFPVACGYIKLPNFSVVFEW